MENAFKIKLYSFTLDCKEPLQLAKFYAELLEWQIVPVMGGEYVDDYVIIAPPGAGMGSYLGITFQKNPEYTPPVWPEEPGAQQQMAHLDFIVTDVEKAVTHAVNCGATVAEKQFSDDWTVMLDPAGHPFCLCKGQHVFDSPCFALL
jgi:predicted enzyme related to lactoylglutathione lyase